MSPEEADRLGLRPFGDGGAENETTPSLGEFPNDFSKRQKAHSKKLEVTRTHKYLQENT